MNQTFSKPPRRFNDHSPRIFQLVFLIVFMLVPVLADAQPVQSVVSGSYIAHENGIGCFALSADSRSAPIVVSASDYPGVRLVADQLVADIERVTSARPRLSVDTIPAAKEIILVGTLGRSPLIDGLVREKKLNVAEFAGKWEMFQILVVNKPFTNIDRALVIVGSDKRGTIYGMYDLSANIGVSPWYWWADVPVRHQSNLFVLPGRHTLGEPAVKYRGIFINDEAPALSGWANEKFGGFNSKFYEHVFELILRLKGNYLWPAMWGSAFYDDDPVNPKLADEYGIVIGTSHHEPMMRAHDEWRRYGKGPWNYEKNDSVLKEFWKAGIRRMGSYESVVTVGMRGDGDMPMSEGANIALLEKIVKDQREILGEVTGREVMKVPQDWALYKEVQDYYDKGMRVPDDVTLLLCDDNWGNIRKLPKLTDKPRAGGHGIYYHYDYVGGPRNYKWLNTNQISRVWEQMHMAYEYGAKQLWIANVGDIKPMEFPIEFFLDYAWNPDAWPAKRLPDYTRHWAEEQFGKAHSDEIAEIINAYTRFNSRRKPELLSAETYSLIDNREAETVVDDYNALAQKAQRLHDNLSPDAKDAFYQLVLHPVLACANLNDLYVTVGLNRLYAKQGRASTNVFARKARELFDIDASITNFYNKIMAAGKWDHMMDQTHIGYTYWQQPDKNVMPEVKEIDIPASAEMGVAIEGSSAWWPDEHAPAILPAFDSYNRQTRFIDVFNRGKALFEFSATPRQPWLNVSETHGTIESEKRIWVSIDWASAPRGIQHAELELAGEKKPGVIVQIDIYNSQSPARDSVDGFVESNGYVSIEAEHCTNASGWQRVDELGRTLSAMIPTPVTVAVQTPGGNTPHLEYAMYLFSKGVLNVSAYVSPSLNFHSDQGLRYAVSFDNDQPQIVTINGDNSNRTWEGWVANNINITTTHHAIPNPGAHILKIWTVDPGIVLQKIVVDAGGVKPSYLGPPESFHHISRIDNATQ